MKIKNFFDEGEVKMERIFKNKNKELRGIWKILLCAIAFNIITLISVILAGLIFQNVSITNFSDMISNTMNSNLGYVLAIIIMSILFYLFYKYIVRKEKITWEDLGFTKKHQFLSILKGFAVGLIFIVIYISILIAMKQLAFEFKPLTANVVYSLFMGLIIFSGVAFAEEITFRGYFQYLLTKKNQYVGLIITAILFAVMHLVNANSYNLLSLIYLVIGGILLGIIRMGTNNIWFPIGFHIAWNWTEIRVFGLDNSTDYHWFSTNIVENTIWNGGESGSGLILIWIELIFIAIFAYLYSRKRKNKVLN